MNMIEFPSETLLKASINYISELNHCLKSSPV